MTSEGAPTRRVALAPWPGAAHGLVGQVRDAFDRVGVQTLTLDASLTYFDTFDALVLCDPPRPSGPKWSYLVARTLKRGGVAAALSGAAESLSSAGVLKSRTVTSCDASRWVVETDGGAWCDQAVCRDGPIVTARGPAHVDAFCATVVQSVGALAHEVGPAEGIEDRLDAALAESFPASDPPQQLRGGEISRSPQS